MSTQLIFIWINNSEGRKNKFCPLNFYAKTYSTTGERLKLTFIIGLLFVPLLSISTVSYTHLDVYKRQVMDNEIQENTLVKT